MKKNYPILIFAFLTIAIMAPLYQDGFVFLLDMVWTPKIQLSDYLINGINSGFPLTLLFKLLSFIIPTEIIQKILLSTILFLCGYLMFRLAQTLMLKKWALLSGIFYMLNPWVYERFLAGHWKVLLGYAILPLAIGLFLKMLKNPSRKNFFIFFIGFSLYPLISLHWTYISFFFLIGLSIIYYFFDKSNKKLVVPYFSLAKASSIFGIIFLAINSFWLFEFFGEDGIIRKITLNDFSAFATIADAQWGSFFNTLSLYGFWQKSYFLPKDYFSWWWILTFLVLFLIIAGAFQSIKKKNTLGITLTFLFIPTLFIAVGYGSPFTKPIIDFLYHTLPGFKGLRETAKISGLLAFTYAILAPLGAQYCTRNISKNSTKIFFVMTMLIPFLWTHSIFWGFRNQLKTYQYPIGWHKTEQMLSASSQKIENVLFLPWHGYLILNFAGNDRIANPARAFFSANIIVGKNLDSVYLLETEQAKWDKKIFSWLNEVATLSDNKNFLKSENVSHIILTKTHDWDRYEFLENSKLLKKIFEDNSVVLYRVESL